MSVSWFAKAVRMARDTRASLKNRFAGPCPAKQCKPTRDLEGSWQRTSEQHQDQNESLKKDARQSWTSEYRKKIKSKKQELRRTKEKEHAIQLTADRTADDMARLAEYKRKKRVVRQEIFRLERELLAAREGWAEGEPVMGALPDFLVIGIGKGGTTFLYHLLVQHPLVEPAASKEVHFFSSNFELGVEWYRQNFPAPRRKDGRTTITGEASPSYLVTPFVPERAAGVVPRARLIALLRNPVDRAYSRYHQMVRREGIRTTFEEVVEEEKAQLPEPSRYSYVSETGDVPYGYQSEYQGIYRGIYVDNLLRWAEFFDPEQMLVLKSEDLFARPQRTLQQVFGFLGLPEWEPDPSQLERKRNSREYEQMHPETRRSLEEYFEPHNRRLYDYLGRDFGW